MMRTLYTIIILAIITLSVISAVPLNSLLATTPTQEPYPTQQSGNNELPRVTLIKLWSVSHTTYLARFVKEKYVVIFTSHGDVSLDGKYISIYPGSTAYIYEVESGKLIDYITADSDGDTYEIDSWEPFQYHKVWDRSGFFSADSKRMAEDARYYGTNARVVDTSTWTAIPVEWGFTDTVNDPPHFYAVQMDYSGSLFVVGDIYRGQVYVFKYDPAQNKYAMLQTLASQKTSGGYYGRRLQMTLDGKIIIVGGKDYPYLEIWKWNDEKQQYEFVNWADVDGGAGALGISDPYNVGYIIVGTDDGWVGIAKYNPDTNEFKWVWLEKVAPDDVWFYNPFYERWIPKVTEIFALCSHRDDTRPGIAVIYDILTNQSIIIHFADPGTPQWKAAAVSPDANYVFVGNTMYMVVKRDIQSGTPRVRFWGTMTFERHMQDLGSTLRFEAPEKDWHLYFYSGRLVISKIYTESIPVTLTDDVDVLQGKLGRLYSRGLVKATKVVESGGTVDALDIEPIDVPEAGFTSDHTLSMSTLFNVKALYGWNGHGFGGATVSSAIVIDVPFTAPLDVYSEVKLQQALSIVTVAPVFDWKQELLGVFGLELLTGGISTATGRALATKAVEKAIDRAIWWGIARKGTPIPYDKVLAAMESASKITKTASKALGIVGIALMVDAGLGVYAHYVTYSSVRSFVMVMPVVEDPYGNKYSAVVLVLPMEEIQGYSGEYSEHIEALAQLFGFKDVGVQYIVWGKDWDEYRTLLEAGSLPSIDLKSAIEATIAAKYGFSLSELKIVGVKIVVETLVHGWTNLWDYVTGGLKVPVVTLVAGSSIQPKAVVAGGKVYSDPATIADMLKKVTINGKDYELVAGSDGAYADFQILLGSPTLLIDFGKRLGYFADIRVDVDVLVKKDMQPLEDFAYTTTLHYDWNGTLINLKRIEFAGMPYPMLKAERTFIYKYGNFTNDITDAFELANKTAYPDSPSGYLYYYVTRENTKYIDPANGGMMQPCKTYVFTYYYREPPDAGIVVYLNGTKITSTLAHHATVAITSTRDQYVTYYVVFAVKYLEGIEEKVLISRMIIDTLHVGANSTSYKTYDISQYVDAAISFMKSQGKTAYLEVTAKIISAKYNYYKSNDIYTVVYYPPLSLPPPLPAGNYTVVAHVFEYVEENHSWVPSPNAVVTAYYGTDVSASELKFTEVTDENGTATFTLPSGIWTFIASKDGYVSNPVSMPVYNDTVINLYLSPVPYPQAENRTYVGENVTVTFYVYDASNGSAVSGANITCTFIEPTNSTYLGANFTATTGVDGKATLVLPIGKYRVEVNATGYLPFTSEYLINKDSTINIALIPTGLTNYARLMVRVFYADGRTYEGAHVEIRNATDNTLIAALATNSLGNATVTLPKGQDYKVSVSVYEPLYGRSYSETKTVTLTQDTEVVFIVPWNSTQIPAYIEGTPYFWLTVQVVWANGLPFHGADVEIFNYSNGELIDMLVTNGTGTVSFLLPAYQDYMVYVSAVNPYNSTQVYTNFFYVNLTDNYWLTVKLPWLPAEANLSKKYRVWVYTYDIVTGNPVPDVTVIARKGDVAWTATTNSTGYAGLWLPFLGIYNFTGIHPNYQAVWRSVQIYDNNTVINLPMSPVILPSNMTPPLNGTYSPIVINGTNYYWLSVQVLWKDGYPFHGALVTVYNRTDNSTLFQMRTNGSGFVHFLIREGAEVRVAVNATHPQNSSLTYYAERDVNMTQHWYLVFRVPWESVYWQPEVWMKSVEFIVHRGQGYFFGNVSHLVLLKIWTNKPQNVTVRIELYNVTSNTSIYSEDVVLSLSEGENVFFEWVEVNATEGGYFRVLANITQWEYDTDLTNNWAWSSTQFLKPMVDIQVFAIWRPIYQKQPWTLLPEDVIEVDIGVVLPINTSKVPAKLHWRVEKYDLKGMKYEVERGALEDIRSVTKGTVWRNVTITIPWTSKIVIIANVTHDWEDFGYNNYINITIPIDPDVKVSIKEKPLVLLEGQIFKVVVNLTSNVEPRTAIGWVSLIDNTTDTLIKRVQVELQPEMTLEIDAKAPDNPAVFGFIKAPTATHDMTLMYAGYDLYTGNNKEDFKVTITSYQWLTVIAIIVIIIAILAAIRALTHSIQDIAQRKRKYVKRKSFITETIEDLAQETRYVKRKSGD